MARKRVLILFPNAWDAQQLASCREHWQDQFELVWGEPSLDDCPNDLDVLAYIDAMVQRWRGKIDGVLSSSDYPGATVAAAIGTGLGLPSPDTAAVMRTAHKYYSRVLQHEAAPEATPAFQLIDTRTPDDLPVLDYPVFVKPVKGAFSVHSRKIHSRKELRAFIDRPVIREFTDGYLQIFNSMATTSVGLDIDGHFFLAEGFMHGVQTTVEGYTCAGQVQVYGIVDSVFHKDTGSFARFDYPSALRPEIQDEMRAIAQRVIPHTGLRQSHFNIEMIYDPATDDIRIIEINPRICGQFGDLYAKVDGLNSYVYALQVATGGVPTRQIGQGRYRCASSFPLRVYEPVAVLHAPDPAQRDQAAANHPGTLVWLECATGDQLDDFHTWEDGNSARYAIINLGADSRRGLRDARTAMAARLDIRFAALATKQAATGAAPPADNPHGPA